jgi:hypothetical protein
LQESEEKLQESKERPQEWKGNNLITRKC